MTEPGAAARVEGLRKAYGDKVVLRDIDLVVEAPRGGLPDRLVGLGKSTLLRCLDLLEAVDDGTICFEGEEITDPRVDARKVRGRMGMVFQALQPVPAPVGARQRHPGAPQGARGRPGEAEARAASCWPRSAADKADEHPDRLSGGQQQRVAMARAGHRPRRCCCSTR